MAEYQIRFEGKPTDAEVGMLLARFGKPPEEGSSIAYGDVTTVLGIQAGDNRWKTITNAWRNRLRREYNAETKAGGGMFTVLIPVQRIDLASTRTKGAFRGIRRAHKVILGTDMGRLEAPDKTRADHLLMVHAKLSLALKANGSKPIELPEPIGGKR